MDESEKWDIVRAFPINPTAGMFSGINQLVNQWEWADREQKIVGADWRECVYSREFGVHDAWDQYFQRVDHFATQVHPLSPTKTRYMGNGRYNIITPRGPTCVSKGTWEFGVKAADASRVVLLPPMRPWRAHHLLRNNLVIKPEILVQVNAMAEDWEEGGPMIGCHVRGALRKHGGVECMLEEMGQKGPPLGLYYEHLDPIMQEEPNARIFLATDDMCVRDAFDLHFGCSRVVWRQESHVIRRGEPHLRQGEEPTADHRHNLGVDVLVEALLLCRTSYYVHGNSNVTNFTQCWAPGHGHFDIFGSFYEDHGWL